MPRYCLEKTEGIPFFIEEFIKSLKDLSIIEKKNDVYNVKKDAAEISIPATIQDVIMARVDSLPETAKSLLQIGSVIGREFSHELITLVMGVSEQKSLSNISISKNSELIYEKGVYPHSTYIFKHALTRDVIYDSILDTKRRKLGIIMGDHVQTGVNSMFNVGSMVGSNVFVGPGTVVDGEIKPYAKLL